MLKRVLKPGDTHLMAPDEEYSRITYERQWNAPDVLDLSIELFDKGGVRLRKNYQKITAREERDITSSVLGNGWETIFVQTYEDWMVRCQKRPRAASGALRYLPGAPASETSGLGLWRSILVGALGVGAAVLLFGWISGQIPSPSTVGNGATNGESTNSDGVGSGEIESDDLNSDSLTLDGVNTNSVDTDSSDPDQANADRPDADIGDDSDDISSGEQVVTDGDTADDDTVDTASNNDDSDDSDTVEGAIAPSDLANTSEPGNTETDSSPTSTDSDDNDPFVLAVRLAQQAVLGGEVAETQEEWEELAERWQDAADLMAEVPSAHERYETAQDRVDQYESNRDVALSEAEKAEAE